MSNILALETSGSTCSVALMWRDTIYDSLTETDRQHTRQILPQIQQVLQEAGVSLKQLDAIAFAAGPGSFTGIRLAASIVQGLSYGADLPVVPISTLQAMAQAAYSELATQKVLVALDAHGQKIYWGCYQWLENSMMPVTADTVMACSEKPLLIDQGEGWVGIGNAWQTYASLLISSGIAVTYPEQNTHAKYIASLALSDFKAGKFVSADQALPIYLYGAEHWQKI
jgi:tRNA threonylcarbamoyladenosine biosynthesis protein TsaB